MTILFVQTERELEQRELVVDFFLELENKLSSPDLIKNVYCGNVKNLGSGFFVVYLRSVITPFNLPKFVFRFMIRKGLKKAGYIGSVKFVGYQDGVRRLLRWDK